MSLQALRYVAERCRHEKVGGSVKNLLWSVAYLVIKGEKRTPGVWLGTLQDMTGDDLRTVQRARDVLCSADVGELKMHVAGAKRVAYELLKFQVQGELFGLRQPGQDDARQHVRLSRSAGRDHDNLTRSPGRDHDNLTRSPGRDHDNLTRSPGRAVRAQHDNLTRSQLEEERHEDLALPVPYDDLTRSAGRGARAHHDNLTRSQLLEEEEDPVLLVPSSSDRREEAFAARLEEAQAFLEQFAAEFSRYHVGSTYTSDEADVGITLKLLKHRSRPRLLEMARLMWTIEPDRNPTSNATFVATAPNQGLRLLRHQRNFLDQELSRRLKVASPAAIDDAQEEARAAEARRAREEAARIHDEELTREAEAIIAAMSAADLKALKACAAAELARRVAHPENMERSERERVLARLMIAIVVDRGDESQRRAASTG